MDKYKANSFDKNYAMAWSQNEGGFSSQVATNLLRLREKGKINFNSCLDILCGTGEFIRLLKKNGVAVEATEVAQSMIDVAKENLPDVKFHLTPKTQDFDFKGKYDLITCNHDCVNLMEKFADWKHFFENAYAHLNKGGTLTFDFYTKKKLQDWVEVRHEESATMDYIKDIKPGMDNKCIMKEIYFIKEKGDLYKKTFDILVESYFENEEIFAALKAAKFKEIVATDIEFNPLSASELENRNRIHILAKK